ncbi:MAG: hypothetical protein WBC71_09810 [Salaquimonas sp.]
MPFKWRQFKNHVLAISLALVLGATSLPIYQVFAEENSEQKAPIESSEQSAERYQLRRDNGGLVRLDKVTGEISTCETVQSKLVCRMAVDERSALQDELASLQDTIDEMQAQIDELKSANTTKDNGSNQSTENKTPLTGKDEKRAYDKKTDSFMDEEVDRVVEYSSKILRRFFTVMKELRDDFEKPSVEN